MKPYKKAYIINSNQFKDPFFAPDSIFYGPRNKAKANAAKELNDAGWMRWDGEEFSYLNTSVIRNPDYDTYFVGGQEKTKKQLEYDFHLVEYNKDLDLIAEQHDGGFAYIKKGGYYYRPKSAGYTEFVHEAGIYSISEAVSECRRCSMSDAMRVIPINIQDHNVMIREKIKALQEKIIDI